MYKDIEKYKCKKKEIDKRYNEKHKDKIRAYKRIWARKNYAKNKSKCLAFSKKWKDSHKQECKKYQQNYNMENKSKVQISKLRTKLKREYNLSLEDYNIMLLEQDYKCAICHRLLEIPYVDHDHKTEKIRGLLCSNCNFLLGQAGDSEEILSNAIEYLRKSKQ